MPSVPIVLKALHYQMLASVSEQIESGMDFGDCPKNVQFAHAMGIVRALRVTECAINRREMPGLLCKAHGMRL